MIQLTKPKLVPVFQQAILFVTQLTNSALLHAFKAKQGKDHDFAKKMLKMYYATDEAYDFKKKYYKDHETEFNPDEWLFEKP